MGQVSLRVQGLHGFCFKHASAKACDGVRVSTKRFILCMKEFCQPLHMFRKAMLRACWLCHLLVCGACMCTRFVNGCGPCRSVGVGAAT